MDAYGVGARICAAQAREARSGTVIQLFAQGLNVRVDAERVFYIGGYDKPLSCIGMQLPAGQLEQLLMWARIGDTVRVESRGLFLSRGDCSVLHLVWDELVESDLSFQGGLSPDACTSIVAALSQAEPQLSIGIARDCELAGALRGLRAGGFAQQDAVYWLLGRGLGLTPSGDDILSGFGVGLRASGKTDAFAQFSEVLAETMQQRATTEVSHSYLEAMRSGLIHEGMLLLMQAAQRGEDLSSAISCARAYGHTSGDDMLLGLLLALAP